jgi:hypothetical protein
MGRDRDFFLLCLVQTGSETNKLPIQRLTRVKWPKLEAYHFLSCSAEVRNAWNFNFNPPIRLRGVELRHRATFTGWK